MMQKHRKHYVLSVEVGEQRGQVHELDRDVVIIGRMAARSDIALLERTMSPVHARFIYLGTGTYGIENLRSTNGTFVNGEKIEDDLIWSLQDGDRLECGEMVLVFREQRS